MKPSRRWYLETEPASFELWTNIFYIIAGLYAYYKNYQSLSLGLIIVAIGSIYYHQNRTPETLMVDQLSMAVTMAIFYNFLNPDIDTFTTALIGMFVVFWYRNYDFIIPWIIFQGLGLFIFYQSPYYAKNKLYFLLYIVGTGIQMFNYPYLHGLKHILQSLAILGILSNIN